jgi:hypothetical protein
VTTTTDTTLLDEALAYAAAGIRVFPCLPAGKTPLTTNGFLDATTDPDRIARIRRPRRRRPPRRQRLGRLPPGRDRRAARRVGARHPNPVRRPAPALPRHRSAQRLAARPTRRLPRHRRVRPAAPVPRADQDLLPPLRADPGRRRTRPTPGLGAGPRPDRTPARHSGFRPFNPARLPGRTHGLARIPRRAQPRPASPTSARWSTPPSPPGSHADRPTARSRAHNAPSPTDPRRRPTSSPGRRPS